MADYGGASPHRYRGGASRDSYRERESQARARQREREHGHRGMDRSREGSDRFKREHENGRHRACDREQSRDRESGSRGRSRDRDRRHHEHDAARHAKRERSLSRGLSRNRSGSQSPSRDRRSKRATGFDMAPSGATVMATFPGQLLGVSQTMPPVLGTFSFAGTQFGTLSTMPMQAMTQQALRHALRVYVGGLPPLANEQTIATFFSQVMAMIGGNSAGPGNAVVNVYINHEKKFAFVEMRTVEEASNAMALDGIIFEGVSVRVRRPSDYNPSFAATLGPSQPSPNLNLAIVGLTPGIVGGVDGPDKLFVGGLPYYLNEAQVKEMLESVGPLRGFDLVKDLETGNSKGYAFCIYQDPAVTDVACTAFNGVRIGNRTLTVRRATVSSQPKSDQASALLQAQQQIEMQKLTLKATGGNAMSFGGLPGLMANGFISGIVPGMGNRISDTEAPSKVVCLAQLVDVDELRDDKEFKDISEDIKGECSKYGNVAKLVIPRPKATGEQVPGLGKAFVEYTDTQGSGMAMVSLRGRKFAGNTVVAMYYPEDKFSRGELDS